MVRIYDVDSSINNGTTFQNFTINQETSDSNDNYIKLPATLCVSVSLVILFVLITTIGFISKLRNGRPQRQMVKFIFLSETVSVFTTLFIFLVVHLVIDRTGCFVVSIFLHYLILVTIMWGSVDVLGCYFVYVKLLGLDFLGYRWKMLASSLVVPLIPIIIIISIDVETYSITNSHRCWYNDYVVYYGLILPSAIVTIVATVIFTVILVHTIRSSSNTTQGHRTRKRIIRRVCKVFGSLVLIGTYYDNISKTS
ncbi:hypothetical protein LOTGIDRAFT_173447 [Lottia gigantea]|uniref:G-protein coupled receptors family 2 profile 2 domain-containing protein n=1 Tax=Lottia gigantea TaxID=225164 RepID=V4AYH6_LOTGI|nr:hypothetical protein LOTGIDRAFT_173447 [Lottia gigantea]ESP00141.1 hypothetical protein LOTGIDRAFT_173447 [Lottia gigantea]